jgi:broad specificity phosphatase PhoE
VGRRSGPNNVLADGGILAPQVPFSDKVYRKAHPAMRTLEIRRHSFRKQGAGSQLSQEGVDYARRLGASIGPFARVVTSVVPRARETAIAMGFAVDEEIVTLASDEDMYAEIEASRCWESSQPLAAVARVVAAKGPTWRYAHALVALWRDILNALPDGAAALVIAHSGELEIALVACFPAADHGAWGAWFEPCEGARLVFDGEPARFTNVEILRSQARESIR